MKKANYFFTSIVMLALSITGFTQTSPLSFTSIPLTTEVPAPGRGAEVWHTENLSDIVSNVLEGAASVMYDVYVRSSLTWDNMEPSQGVYNWTNFDGAMNDAISKGRKLSFSIMALFPGYNGGVTANGVGMAYPLYLHNLMQSEGGNNTDWISPQNPSWVPNYNSANWQARVSALLNALAAHINSASFNGKNYKDALGVVSIGLMGAWAEWNFSNLVGNVATEFPAGRIPTFAAGKALIDAYINAFPNNPLVIPHAAFDHQQLQNVWTDPQTGWYALTATNKWGKIGITRMNWGLTESYISAWAENNTFTYNGLRFDTAIMNRYKYAPLTGEVAGYNAAVGGAPFWDLPRQVTFYHASSFGNGNFQGEQNSLLGGLLPGHDNIRAAWRASGYRLVLEGGTISSTISRGSNFSISLNWRNIGVAPTYENWDVLYELRNATDNSVVLTAASSFHPKLFLPSDLATTITDNYTIPGTVPDGNYNVVLVIRDPTGYRQPLPLAMEGRNTDGSYLLKSFNLKGGAVAAGVSAPGTIFTTQNPGNEVYGDGRAVELGVKFQSAVAGSITGVRFYKHATDSGTHIGELYSSTGTRLAQAVFASESTSGWQQVQFSKPIAVSANTTYIAAYHNSSGTYAATNNYYTVPLVNNGLSALADGTDGVNGVYIYSDSPAFPNTSNGKKPNYWVDIMFSTNAAAATTVTANAGTNQTIALPASAVKLDGSKSTGTISSYAWTKVSGPNNPVVVNTSKGDTVDLVLLQGESNAAGMAYNTQATSLELSPRNNVKVINNNTLQFETLQLGINNNILQNLGGQSTHGMEIALADAANAGRLSNPVYLVKAGGAGSLINEWLSNGSSHNPGEYSWAQLTGRMDAAVNYLKSKGIPYKITVWQSIGINDYNAGTSNSSFLSQMQQFGAELRNRYGQHIPFYITHFFSGHPYNAVIDAIAASDPLGISSAIDVSGATFRDQNIHWDHNGLVLIASRMIDKMVSQTAASSLTSLSGIATGLIQGVYVFQLSINAGAAVSQVTVTVNAAAVTGAMAKVEMATEQSISNFSYQLNQNFPNPVNQYTNITYSIPAKDKVELILYDVLGTQTKVLVNETKEAGTYSYQLDAGNLRKGTYFYKMRSGKFSASKTLVIQ